MLLLQLRCRHTLQGRFSQRGTLAPQPLHHTRVHRVGQAHGQHAAHIRLGRMHPASTRPRLKLTAAAAGTSPAVAEARCSSAAGGCDVLRQGLGLLVHPPAGNRRMNGEGVMLVSGREK